MVRCFKKRIKAPRSERQRKAEQDDPINQYRAKIERVKQV